MVRKKLVVLVEQVTTESPGGKEGFVIDGPFKHEEEGGTGPG